MTDVAGCEGVIADIKRSKHLTTKPPRLHAEARGARPRDHQHEPPAEREEREAVVQADEGAERAEGEADNEEEEAMAETYAAK